MEDLQPKRCPHNCEDDNTQTVEIIHEAAGVRVMCTNCQTSGPLLEGMDNAIKAWNAQFVMANVAKALARTKKDGWYLEGRGTAKATFEEGK